MTRLPNRAKSGLRRKERSSLDQVEPQSSTETGTHTIISQTAGEVVERGADRVSD